MEIQTDVDPKIWQRAAEHELAYATHARNILLNAHQDAYKWLLASLFALNSGGMLAVLNVDFANGVSKLAAAILFYFGLMAALLSSYLSQRADRKLLEPLGKSMGYWISVVQDGEHLPEVWEPISQELTAAVRYAWPTQTAGWASVLCFSLGVFSIGLSIDEGRAGSAKTERGSVEEPNASR